MTIEHAKPIAWSYESFVEQAHELFLLTPLHVQPKRVAYLHVQQDMLEADIDCAFRSHSQFPAPYLDMRLRHGNNALRAKAIIFNGELIGCFWRQADQTQERFRMRSADELIALLKSELHEPSLNFCTIFGDNLHAA